MNWISTDERLPPLYQTVPLLLKGKYKRFGRAIVGPNGLKWVLTNDSCYTRAITHWYELPDAPAPEES